jgi:hypothetical protein
MINLGRTLTQLQQERSRTQKELHRLDGAISALEKLVTRAAIYLENRDSYPWTFCTST